MFTCYLCQQATLQAICPYCEACLPWPQPEYQGDLMLQTRVHRQYPQANWDGLYALSDYAWPLDLLIPKVKFAGKYRLIDMMARWQVAHWQAHQVPLPEVLIPVPLHDWRLVKRGFNQAQRLAEQLGHAFALPVLNDRLRRKQATQAQAQLSGYARQANVQDAFMICDPQARLFDYQHFAIVDDVLTSGATVNAAVATLQAYHPDARIDVWVLAQNQLN